MKVASHGFSLGRPQTFEDQPLVFKVSDRTGEVGAINGLSGLFVPLARTKPV